MVEAILIAVLMSGTAGVSWLIADYLHLPLEVCAGETEFGKSRPVLPQACASRRPAALNGGAMRLRHDSKRPNVFQPLRSAKRLISAK